MNSPAPTHYSMITDTQSPNQLQKTQNVYAARRRQTCCQKGLKRTFEAPLAPPSTASYTLYVDAVARGRPAASMVPIGLALVLKSTERKLKMLRSASPLPLGLGPAASEDSSRRGRDATLANFIVSAAPGQAALHCPATRLPVAPIRIQATCALVLLVSLCSENMTLQSIRLHGPQQSETVFCEPSFRMACPQEDFHSAVAAAAVLCSSAVANSWKHGHPCIMHDAGHLERCKSRAGGPAGAEA